MKKLLFLFISLINLLQASENISIEVGTDKYIEIRPRNKVEKFPSLKSLVVSKIERDKNLRTQAISNDTLPYAERSDLIVRLIENSPIKLFKDIKNADILDIRGSKITVITQNLIIANLNKSISSFNGVLWNDIRTLNAISTNPINQNQIMLYTTSGYEESRPETGAIIIDSNGQEVDTHIFSLHCRGISSVEYLSNGVLVFGYDNGSISFDFNFTKFHIFSSKIIKIEALKEHFILFFKNGKKTIHSNNNPISPEFELGGNSTPLGIDYEKSLIITHNTTTNTINIENFSKEEITMQNTIKLDQFEGEIKKIKFIHDMNLILILSHNRKENKSIIYVINNKGKIKNKFISCKKIIDIYPYQESILTIESKWNSIKQSRVIRQRYLDYYTHIKTLIDEDASDNKKVSLLMNKLIKNEFPTTPLTERFKNLLITCQQQAYSITSSICSRIKRDLKATTSCSKKHHSE